MKKIPSKEQLKKMYALGYSMKEIGKYLGYSSATIWKYFKKYKITPRRWGINEISKIKMAKTKTGVSSKTKGKKLSEETKNKISISKIKKGIGHKKKRSDGYICIYFPDHPKSNKDGYIMEHDLVMECVIGRHLKKDEIVHHINHVRNDNRIENLKLMTFKEHAKMHMLERYKKGECIK